MWEKGTEQGQSAFQPFSYKLAGNWLMARTALSSKHSRHEPPSTTGHRRHRAARRTAWERPNALLHRRLRPATVSDRAARGVAAISVRDPCVRTDDEPCAFA